MIRSNLDLIRVQKERREGRKLPYRVIADETGLSQGVLVRLMGQGFDKVEKGTLNTICTYFGCSVGELLEYVPDAVPAEGDAE